MRQRSGASEIGEMDWRLLFNGVFPPENQ